MFRISTNLFITFQNACTGLWRKITRIYYLAFYKIEKEFTSIRYGYISHTNSCRSRMVNRFKTQNLRIVKSFAMGWATFNWNEFNYSTLAFPFKCLCWLNIFILPIREMKTTPWLRIYCLKLIRSKISAFQPTNTPLLFPQSSLWSLKSAQEVKMYYPYAVISRNSATKVNISTSSVHLLYLFVFAWAAQMERWANMQYCNVSLEEIYAFDLLALSLTL